MTGFKSHIKEAIELNRKRKPYYANITNGESASLSRSLILLERMVIPIAWYFDCKAAKFNKKGIPIVKNDFVTMEVKPQETLPKFTSNFSSSILSEEQESVRSYLRKLRKNKDLMHIYVVTLKFYEVIGKAELSHQIHFAMLLHMLESVMLITKNGIIYANQSKGKTKSLTLKLIYIHKFAIRNALKIDQKANIFHRQNVGIIINDLPKITFP